MSKTEVVYGYMNMEKSLSKIVVLIYNIMLYRMQNFIYLIIYLF